MKDAKKNRTLSDVLSDFTKSNHIISGQDIAYFIWCILGLSLILLGTSYNLGSDSKRQELEIIIKQRNDKLIELHKKALAKSCDADKMSFNVYTACESAIDKKYLKD